MKKNTLKRFMASAMTAVMCVSSLGTLAVNAAPADPAAETSVVDNLMSKMTLRQKIAQMMMPDFRKWQTESDSGQKNFQVMNDEVAQIIKDYDFGGVILFAENVAQTDQTLKLTTDLQEAVTGVKSYIGKCSSDSFTAKKFAKVEGDDTDRVLLIK